ncbi:hypothetical protein SAMN02745866_01058 [Alteromonadaceae bacterium Bs31]|nr:hypothetical protein SAMN02745866_01058 [Alteromonadaceae bacterium Bs31]
MAKPYWDVVNAWGGKHEEFYQGEELGKTVTVNVRFDQSGVAKGVNVDGGICFAICQQWVKLRKTRGHISMNRFKSGSSTMQMCKGNQSKDWLCQDSYSLSGFTTHFTKRSNFWRRLTSRNKVSAAVFNTPGLYIYSAYDKHGKSGHAVAFDTRVSHGFCFMDPNAGQFWYGSGSKPTKAAWQNWFYDYWENDWLEYKKSFRKGNRELCRYASSG